MPTTSINLTDGLHDWIVEKVTSGNYNNASEVIREGLRLMREQEELRELELELLRQKVLIGLNQAKRGEFSGRNVKKIIADSKKLLKKNG